MGHEITSAETFLSGVYRNVDLSPQSALDYDLVRTELLPVIPRMNESDDLRAHIIAYMELRQVPRDPVIVWGIDEKVRELTGSTKKPLDLVACGIEIVRVGENVHKHKLVVDFVPDEPNTMNEDRTIIGGVITSVVSTWRLQSELRRIRVELGKITPGSDHKAILKLAKYLLPSMVTFAPVTAKVSEEPR